MAKIKQVIKLTQEGYENLQFDISKAELELIDIRRRHGELLKDNPIKDDHPDSIIIELRQKEKSILRDIKSMMTKLSLAQVVDKIENTNVVQLGDFIRVNLSYDGELLEPNHLLEITGNIHAAYDFVHEQISQDSPLAQQLLNKKVGARVSFKTPAKQLCEAEILEIVKGLKNGPKQKVLAK
jgi:transcription elongation GreA/GreB family factor